MSLMRPIVVLLAVAIAVAATPMAQTPAAPPSPSDAEIRKILADRIDVHRQSVGIVVGVVDANRPAYRRLRQAGGQGRPAAARWRHDLRDRVDDEGVHVAAAGRRGPSGRKWR